MTGDIDIKEHDVLDIIQLSDIKTEPIEDNYDCATRSQEIATVKEEFMDDESPQEITETSIQSIPSIPTVKTAIQQNNRITLGSKPCPKRKIKELFVSLENLANILDRSQCYCKQCMILFASRNDLDAHKVNAHPLLVALDTPKDLPEEKYTPKQNNKFTLRDNVKISDQNSYCIYLACAICSCYFKSDNEYYRHCNLMHGAFSDANTVTSSPDDPVKCKYCGRTSVNPASHNRHIRVIHKSMYFKLSDEQTTKRIPKKPDLKRKNIEFPEPNAKRKAPASTTSLKEIQEMPNKQIQTMKHELYYCGVCKSFMKNLQNREYHLSNKCIAIKSDDAPLYLCITCGLEFSCDEQLKLHKEQHVKTNTSLNDYKFVCVRTLKPCNPLLPEFIQCVNCKAHYISKHISCFKGPSKTCNLCNKLFTNEAYQLHLIHHDVMNPTSNKSTESPLKMKNRTPGNIFYNCKVCDVTTDSYDDVIDHCQKHLNKMVKCDVTKHNCEVCILKFEEKCYNRHKELHQNQTINRNAFMIISYDYLCMLTDDWLKVFDPLPKEQMRQILSDSIYITPTVKMRVLQDGPPEYTVYKCLRCFKFVENEDVSNHTAMNKCKAKSNLGHKCSACHFIFTSHKAQTNHAFIHKTESVTAKSFRIVSFNHPRDVHYNSILRSSCKMKNISKRMFKIASGYRFLYYRCEKCYCCVKSKAAGKKKHVCVSEEKMRLCRDCNFVFPKSGFKMHYHQRHVLLKMTSDDVLIQPFNDNIKPGEWRVSLSECSKCSMKFPTHLIENHDCIKKQENGNSDKKQFEQPEPNPVTNRCPGCKVMFSKTMLVKHKKDCAMNEIQDKMDSSESQKEIIYKCNQCNVYMLSGQDVRNHQNFNHKYPVITRCCSICEWRFSIRSYHKHVPIHHKILKLTPKDFSIIEFDHENTPPKTHNENSHNKIKRNKYKRIIDIDDDEEFEDNEFNINNENKNVSPRVQTSDEKKINATYASVDKKYGHYKNSLFRCAKCDIHYLTIRSWIHHIQLNHKMVVRVECPECGLKFTDASLKKHLPSHKKLKICNIITPEETHIVPHGSKLQRHSVGEDISTNTNESIVSQSVNEDEATKSEAEQTIAPKNNTARDSHETATLRDDPSSLKMYTHKLYKCKECDVYFMFKRACYTHMLRHTPMEPKDYVECKFCNLNFKIMALSIHFKMHHNKHFNLDEILVEEYSNEGGETPKVEIYYAIDTVQSRLVSTTCDEPTCNTVMYKEKRTSRIPDDSISTSIEEYDITADVELSSVNNEGRTKHESTDFDEDESSAIKVKQENIANKKHECRFCDEIFNNKTSKDFHESLDHLDCEKECEICKLSFNMSILNELHLNIRNDTFECCLCRETLDLRDMSEHAYMHF